MSVLVTMRVRGDTQQFRDFMGSGTDRLHSIRDAAQAAGCLHHRFGVGDGFVLVVDEWTSAEAFQGFMATNEQIAGVIRDAGAQGEPEIMFTDAIETPDQF